MQYGPQQSVLVSTCQNNIFLSCFFFLKYATSLIVKIAHSLVDGARCPENLFTVNDERWTGLDPFDHSWFRIHLFDHF